MNRATFLRSLVSGVDELLTIFIPARRERYLNRVLYGELCMGLWYDYRDEFWRVGNPGAPHWAEYWRRVEEQKPTV